MDKKLKTFPQISQDAVEVYKKNVVKNKENGQYDGENLKVLDI